MKKSSKSSIGVRQEGPRSKQENTYEYWSFRIKSSKVRKFEDLIQLLEKFQAYRFQLEKVDVEHYQGTFHTKPKKRRSQLRKMFEDAFDDIRFPSIDYLEKSQSAAADRYVMKEDTRVDGPWEKNMPKPKIDMTATDDDIMQLEELPQWSQDVINMVGGCLPDKKARECYWFWSEEGAKYKTETCRHLAYYHGAYILNGASRHVLAACYANPAPIYIFCLPRTREEGISYKSIELIKDSLYFSGFGTKATGMVLRKKPWVLIFCNFEPAYESLSADKWVVKNVDDKKNIQNDEFFSDCDLSVFG